MIQSKVGVGELVFIDGDEVKELVVFMKEEHVEYWLCVVKFLRENWEAIDDCKDHNVTLKDLGCCANECWMFRPILSWWNVIAEVILARVA